MTIKHSRNTTTTAPPQRNQTENRISLWKTSQILIKMKRLIVFATESERRGLVLRLCGTKYNRMWVQSKIWWKKTPEWRKLDSTVMTLKNAHTSSMTTWKTAESLESPQSPESTAAERRMRRVPISQMKHSELFKRIDAPLKLHNESSNLKTSSWSLVIVIVVVFIVLFIYSNSNFKKKRTTDGLGQS